MNETLGNGRPGGRVALVTGGSRGIGAAVALRLADDGADVALTYQHSADQVAEVVERITALGRRAVALRADSADPKAVREAVDTVAGEFGRLDVLVNNAGIGMIGPLESFEVADVDRILHVNVRGPYLAAQAAAARMTEGGRIISVGSFLAERVPFAGASLYAMSKSALVGMVRGLARELGPRGITANLVHPGPIDTDLNPADGPSAEALCALTALDHYGLPSDVAAMVAHLAGDGGRYVTGAQIAVDGGVMA